MDATLKKLLNQQITTEFESSQLYLGMATWADVNNFPGAAHFLYAQALEEREHMMKIVLYLTDLGIQPLIPNSDMAQPRYASLEELIKKTLQAEQQVTKAIHHLVQEALRLNDLGTYHFLQWFIEEQREEESTARKNNALFERLDANKPLQLYTIDQEIRKNTPA